MKLELKHLAPYLPYELNCHIQGHHNQDGTPMKEKILGIYDGTEVFTSLGLKDYETNEIEDVYPILRPLSDLTKEINYGLSSYAFVDLFEIGDYDGCVFEFEHGNIKTINSINSIAQHSSYHDINYLPHAVVNMMVEYHFDIFGLIDAGLAIDINRISK